MTRSYRTLALGLLLAVQSACVTTGEVMDLEPGESPAIESDEAGIWLDMKRAERSMQTSGYRIKDPALEAYLHRVLCRLSEEYCPDIRIYVMRVPAFNASMSPNGVMLVFSGLLLRAQNEAQVATVLGHELAHYVRRHSLQRMRDLRNKADALAFFQIATAMGGIGFVGNIATIATMGTVASFSRDMERESDALGTQFVADAGYDPREAVKIWQYVLDESNAVEKQERSVFLASHPAVEERIENLTKQNAKTVIDANLVEKGRSRFDAVTRGHRAAWFRDELRKDSFKETVVLIEHLMRGEPASGELHFLMGELHRLRDQDDDPQAAIDAYRQAIKLGGAPPEVHRSLAFVHWDQGDVESAKRAFAAYIDADPGADDRLMIESYINELETSAS